MTCKNCEYSFVAKALEGGGLQCRLNPPVPFPMGSGNGQLQIIAFFPPVTEEMSCGAFEPAEFIEATNAN